MASTTCVCIAARGFRSLGVARAGADGKWRLQGVLPLFDPPRDDAKSTIATAVAMGVKVKMVTGDALAIAKETAQKLGMGSNILSASILGDGKQKETPAQAASIETADGFAQVFPEHKFRIIDVLQKHGHIVGMTGDGVNDAPALKKADCHSARCLTPYRRRSLTPASTCEALGPSTKNASRVGSTLEADGGQSSALIHKPGGEGNDHERRKTASGETGSLVPRLRAGRSPIQPRAVSPDRDRCVRLRRRGLQLFLQSGRSD